MNFPKKTLTLILSLFVSLIVGVLEYFIILLLPVFLSDTSSWKDVITGTVNSYAAVGAFIVFALTAQRIYKELIVQWGNDGTQDTVGSQSEND